MLLRVFGHHFDILRQLDELLVLHARAGGARDDVEPLVEARRNRAEAPRLNVRQNLARGGNLQPLVVERHGERDAHRVADALRDQLLEGHARLDHALRRHARLGHAEVQRHIGPLRGEATVDLDDLLPVRVLERDDVTLEAEPIEQRAVLGGAGHDRRNVVARVALEHPRVDRAAVDAHPDRAVVVRGGLGDKGDLVGDALLLLVVVQVAGVVADLVHMRRDLDAEAVVLLQVDGERRAGLRPHLGQRRHILARVDGDPHQIRPRRLQQPHLPHRRLHILRARGGHRLHDDRATAANRHIANLNRAGRVASGHGELLGMVRCAAFSVAGRAAGVISRVLRVNEAGRRSAPRR